MLLFMDVVVVVVVMEVVVVAVVLGTSIEVLFPLLFNLPDLSSSADSLDLSSTSSGGSFGMSLYLFGDFYLSSPTLIGCSSDPSSSLPSVDSLDFSSISFGNLFL